MKVNGTITEKLVDGFHTQTCLILGFLKTITLSAWHKKLLTQSNCKNIYH